MMRSVLFVGFKGKNNTSGVLAESLSPQHLLLTNSFAGLKKDIDSACKEYDCAVMFGVDKTLKDAVRIEKTATLEGKTISTVLEAKDFKTMLESAGIAATISEVPTAYLCNEAYWHMLKKLEGRAVFIHIPTVKYADGGFMEKMRAAFRKI